MNDQPTERLCRRARQGSSPPTASWSRPASCPPASTSRASWSSRRATPRMATWRPMRRWCWPRTPAASRANWPKRLPQSCAPTSSIAKVEVAGPGFINLTLKPAAWIDALRAVLAGRRRLWAQHRGAGRAGQRRIRLRQSDRARCMSAIAAARCSAMRSPTCWRSPASRSRANTTSTMPAPRSTCSRARRYLRYREALGEDIGAIPEGLYPGDYLKPVGAALVAEYGRALLDKPESGLAAARARSAPST